MNIIQSVMKNTRIRCMLAICACLWTAIAIHAVSSYAFSKDINITEAFSVSDNIKVTGCSIESTACLNCDRQYFELYGGELLERISDEFGVNSSSAVIYRKQPVMCYMLDNIMEDYRIHATVSWSEDMKKAYLHCNIEVLTDVGRLRSAYSKITDTISSCKQDGKIADAITYTRTDAVRPGRMTEHECRLYTMEMFERLGATEKNAGGDSYYTGYGYTPDISEYLRTNDEKINVQVSYGYNEINDTTEISIGSPIINSAY